MNSQQQIIEFSEKVSCHIEPDQFWEFCDATLHDNGISGMGYGLIPYATEAKVNGYSQAGYFRHTYPNEWAEAIPEQNSLDDDISVEMILNGHSEVSWHELNSDEILSKEQRIQNSIDNDIGMRFGASIALDKNAFGQAISGVGLWTKDVKTEKEFSEYWREHRKSIHQICHILDEGLRGHHARLLVALTPRERDCLTYLAIGLRSVDICWRLKISEKTFEKYVRGAKDKLKATTRDHAVAKALVLNLIRP